MTIWIIAALYQGVYDGIEIATLSEEKARGEYRRLVHEAMGFAGRDNPQEDVEKAYELAIENCAKIEEYYLDAIEIT